MTPEEYPTPWQRKTMWSALSTVAVVAIGAIAVGLIWIVTSVIGFLQPILIPFAVAGVMAYLLDPVVSKVVAWGTSRQRAVWAVFAIVTVVIFGIAVWIVPALSDQTVNLAKRVPGYTVKAKKLVIDFAEHVHVKYGVRLLPATSPFPIAPGEPAAGAGPKTPATVANPTVPPNPPASPTVAPEHTENLSLLSILTPKASAAKEGEIIAEPSYALEQFLTGDWVKTTLPTVLRNAWNVIRTSVGGFLGVFGFLLSMVIVPVYLYYFLIEGPTISESWGEYLPLRASEFKDEVIGALNEINGYLIAFFRGQLVVSMINGVATGTLLVAAGLEFGLLIGLMLCFLGFIPYLGIILCWIPAVIIASVQGGSWLVPAAAPWFFFPLVVTGIFVVVQQVDGLFVTPKIVGGSVGLHPMTVIVSVFVWGLLLGGLLGAILAVPLTATIKVLLRRYIWQRRLRAEDAVMTEETYSEQQAQEPEKSETAAGK
jgi:predicted PurR-regulated permease PerM